jgi:preprotein translocase subunit SecD
MKLKAPLVAAACVSAFALSNGATAQTQAPQSAPVQQAPAAAPAQPVPLYIHVSSPTPLRGWDKAVVAQDTLYIDPLPAITSQDLTHIDPMANDKNQGFIGLYFNDAGKAKLLKMSTQHKGKRVAVLLGDQIVAAPQLADPLSDGVMIFGVVSPQAAQIIAHAVAGLPLPQSR